MTPAEFAALLRANPVFAALPPQEIGALAQVARHERIHARDFVFMEGDAARLLYIVRAGRVKILKHSRAGKDVVLELLGPGEVFGACAVLERRPYPATAQAMEVTEVVGIPGDAVLPLLDRYPSIMRELALMIGRRLRTAHEAVRSLSLEPVEVRLAAVLLRLAAREGRPAKEGIKLPYHLTRQSLGEMAGTTVESTIRVVSRWIKCGLVSDDAGCLVLRDQEALRKLAQVEPPCPASAPQARSRTLAAAPHEDRR